jgi:hypothetical protein
MGRHGELTVRNSAALLELEVADSNQFVGAVAFLAVVRIRAHRIFSPITVIVRLLSSGHREALVAVGCKRVALLVVVADAQAGFSARASVWREVFIS